MNRVLPLMTVATLLLTGCPGDALRPGRDLDVTRITPDAPNLVHYSGLSDPMRLAVFDAATFAEVWGRAFGNQEPAPKPPAVDFETDFVVVAALGERSSGGYEIKVAGAREEGGGIEIGILATAPGKGCPVTMAMTQPIDIVRLKRSGPGSPHLSFAEKQVVTGCGP